MKPLHNGRINTICGQGSVYLQAKPSILRERKGTQKLFWMGKKRASSAVDNVQFRKEATLITFTGYIRST